MRIELAITVILFLGTFTGAVIAVESRYTKTEAFEQHLADGAKRIQEADLWRLQDRLNYLLSIPADKRLPWMDKEIKRLEMRIEELSRRISKG